MADTTAVANSGGTSLSEYLINSLEANKEVIPVDVNQQRLVLNSLEVVRGNDTLTRYMNQYAQNGHAAIQLKTAILKCAVLGLDPMMKEAYFIPYGSNLTVMKDWRGDIKLCMKYSSRPILTIDAKLIKKADKFRSGNRDGKPFLEHEETWFSDDPEAEKIVGAYAVVTYKDGGVQYDVMTTAEIENSRNASKAKNSPTWTKYWGEMAKKTVIHRLCKHIPIAFENAFQAATFDEDTAIETDAQKIAEQDVSNNANSEAFTIGG